MDPAAPTAAEQLATAAPAPKLTCKKCGKPYLRGGKKFEEHEAICDGKPWQQKVVRHRTAAPAPPEPPKPQTPLEKAIGDLELRRAGLTRDREVLMHQVEIMDKESTAIDQALEKLREAKVV